MRSVPLGADRSRRGAACALQVAEWKADVDRLKKKHTQEVAKARAEWERKLKEAEKQAGFQSSMELTRLKGSLEGQVALKEREERETRIELLRKQAQRRMLNAGIAAAWSAWADYYEARTYALDRLRQCANRLRSRDARLSGGRSSAGGNMQCSG